jgi:hypothetical protein
MYISCGTENIICEHRGDDYYKHHKLGPVKVV